MSLVIALSISGAAADPSASADSRAQALANRASAPVRCSARKAVRFYSRRLNEHRAKMGAARVSPRPRALHGGGCPRYLAAVLKRKAHAWRLRAAAWWEFHWNWRSWLPANWAALGACETGYGRRPGNWSHDSGTYVSAFGLYRPNYQNGAARTHTRPWRSGGPYPTPREQYEVALSHYRVYGDGWGCPGP